MVNKLDYLRRCFQPRQWFIGDGEPDPFPLSEEDTFMWVYRRENNPDYHEGHCFAVGYFAPDGSWFPESAYEAREDAAARVRYLNGGNSK